MPEEMIASVPAEQAAESTKTSTPEVAAQTPASAEGTPNTSETKTEEKPEGGYQRVKRQREEARREAEFWRQQAMSRQSAPEKAPEPEVKDDPEPNADDEKYQSEGGLAKFVRDTAAWARREAVREAKAEFSKEKQAETQKSEQEKAAERWEQKNAAAAAKNPQHEELADAAIDAIRAQVTPQTKPTLDALGKAIAAHESGPELLAELGKNPGEVARLAKLPQTMALMELGVLAARLAGQEPAAEPEPEKVTEPPPQSKAPRPATPVTKPTVAKAPELEEMNFKEFCKAREAKQKG